MPRPTEYQALRHRRKVGFRVFRRAGVFYSLSMAACYRASPEWRDRIETIKSNLRAAREADIAWRAAGGTLY